MAASDMTVPQLIERHEGRRLKPYRCPGGKLTIGVGINLDAGLYEDEVDYLRDGRIRRAHSDLLAVFGVSFGGSSKVRQAALISMRFQLGPGGFRGFRQMISAVRMGAWHRAADDMLDSAWHQQTPNRANELAEMLRCDEWPDGK